MKAALGIAPAVAIIAILAAAGVGIGTPTALAEMQHRNVTKFLPGDLPYGIMRAGENIMGLYQSDKGRWNEELMQIRERERNELQVRCPNCTEQIQELEQEQERIRLREEERQRIELNKSGEEGNRQETENRNEGNDESVRTTLLPGPNTDPGQRIGGSGASSEE